MLLSRFIKKQEGYQRGFIKKQEGYQPVNTNNIMNEIVKRLLLVGDNLVYA